MLFFIVVLAGLVLWAVIAAVLAATRDTDRHGHHEADALGRSPEDRRSDYPLLTDPAFFSR